MTEAGSLLFSCQPTGANIVQSADASVSSFKLNPKHKIFLSHAGAQKNFTEQLLVDLEAKGYIFPFFDQSSHSLPKGKTFASLILEAAKQCHVAVIVLSEEFLTSKWPMIELAAFHDAKQEGNQQLTMLPLFFKISIHDLDDLAIENRWVPRWRELANTDQRIDPNKWTAVVKALCGLNGLVYDNYGNREVAYRSAVTKEIFRLSPPDLDFGTFETVVGCDRICKTLASQFEANMKFGGPLLLGLYGMGGIGKTTISKALCDHFRRGYLGKVCHVELGGNSTTLERQKKVLEDLCNFDHDVLHKIKDIDEGWTIMRERLQWQPVFLVIDNVDVELFNEAQGYLNSLFHPKSKIMVTARSQQIVMDLLSDSHSKEPTYFSEFCKPVPDLTEEEAGTIFLRNAAPKKTLSKLTDEERRILRLCVQQCRFLLDVSIVNESSKQYHPLALLALGNYFFECSRTQSQPWDTYVTRDKLFWELEPNINAILGKQFSTFDESEQLLFFDIALYGKEWITASIETSIERHSNFEDWVTWLTGLHGEEQDVKIKLWHLKKASMIDWFNYGGITMHQLYKEYAEWYVTKGEGSKKAWCVYHTKPLHVIELSRRGRSSDYWLDLMRIRIVGLKGAISRKIVKEQWSNVVVLQLHHCNDLKQLNLHGLYFLRHLELIQLKNLVKLVFSENTSTTVDEDDDDMEYDTLYKLKFVFLEGLDSMKHLPDFQSCPSLQTIIIRKCLNLTEHPRIEGCLELRSLRLSGLHSRQGKLPTLTALSSLRVLVLSCISCNDIEDGALDLGGLRQLNSLYLQCLPVRSLPGLAQLTRLTWLDLCGCSLLEEIPELNPKSALGVHYYYARRKGRIFGNSCSGLCVEYGGHMMANMDVRKAIWEEFCLIREEDDPEFSPEAGNNFFDEATGTLTYYKHVPDGSYYRVGTIYSVKILGGDTYIIEEVLGDVIGEEEWEEEDHEYEGEEEDHEYEGEEEDDEGEEEDHEYEGEEEDDEGEEEEEIKGDEELKEEEENDDEEPEEEEEKDKKDKSSAMKQLLDEWRANRAIISSKIYTIKDCQGERYIEEVVDVLQWGGSLHDLELLIGFWSECFHRDSVHALELKAFLLFLKPKPIDYRNWSRVGTFTSYETFSEILECLEKMQQSLDKFQQIWRNIETNSEEII